MHEHLPTDQLACIRGLHAPASGRSVTDHDAHETEVALSRERGYDFDVRHVLPIVWLLACAATPEVQTAQPQGGDVPRDAVDADDWSRVQAALGRLARRSPLQSDARASTGATSCSFPWSRRMGPLAFRPEDKNGALCTTLRAALKEARGPGPAAGRNRRPASLRRDPVRGDPSRPVYGCPGGLSAA